jgi:hypothetical protein
VSQYAWPELRQHAVRRFHDAPSAAIEQRVIDVFREHPVMVVEAVAHIGARFEAGKIRAPWVVLAQHVEQAVRPLEDVHATDARDRTKQVERASQWMRAAGKHFDSEDELLDALFGDNGQLRQWASDERLRERMRKLWNEVRPEGVLIDEQAEERARAWWAMREKLVASREPSDDDIPW